MEVQVQTLKEQLSRDNLIVTQQRSINCPSEGGKFKDLADQVVAISQSLTEGKCYEKHAETIGKLNQIAQDEGWRSSFDMSPSANGSFIDSTSTTSINITNNQIQNVENNNSVMNGLFTIAKDKDCVESLRRSNMLSSVASSLTKLGTFGLFLPSSLGIFSSGILLATGSSLYILDRLIQPEFTWHVQQDRQDFVALTCSFYHLRTQLYKHGFFDSLVEEPEVTYKKIDTSLEQLKALTGAAQRFKEFWVQDQDLALNQFLSGRSRDEESTRLFQLLQKSLQLLESSAGRGESPIDRLTVSAYFLKRSENFRDLLPHRVSNVDFRRKVIQEIEAVAFLPAKEVQSMSTRAWQIGFNLTLQEFFKSILAENLSDIAAEMKEYEHVHANENVVVLRVKKLQSELSQLISDLEIKRENIRRAELRRSTGLDHIGARNEYDIHREFSNIRKILLGKKGWSYISFLISDAKHHIDKFDGIYNSWKPNSENKGEMCRLARSLALEYDTAKSAADLAEDYLKTNQDLWSDYHSKVVEYFSFLPLYSSYKYSIVKAYRSSENSKKYIASGSLSLLREIDWYGLILLQINGKARTEARQALETYRAQNGCDSI